MPDEYLTCPNDGQRLVEHEEDEGMVECLLCEYVCQNFLKYPVAEIYVWSTGERYLKNFLTGERVSSEEAPEVGLEVGHD